MYSNWRDFQDEVGAGVGRSAANVSLATFTCKKAGQIATLAAMAGIALDTLWKFVVSNRLVWR